MPNAKVLESKKTVVDALSDKIQNATAAVFVDYKGITVAQDTELRNQFRAAGVEYSVVKNTLTRFAANKAGYTEFDEVLNGTTSMASTTDDPIAPARVICEFAKKTRTSSRSRAAWLKARFCLWKNSCPSASCLPRTHSLRRSSARSSLRSPLWQLF